MEEEIIIITKPRQQQTAASYSELSAENGATVTVFSSRSEAIAYLSGTEAADDRA